MAARPIIFVAVVSCTLLLCACYVQAVAKDCPPSSKMTACSPKCKEDVDCLGQKCCPNICNTKSCTKGNELSGQASGGYKGSSNGATGSYCGNVKCNSYEKCELDRTTKRQKCVRT